MGTSRFPPARQVEAPPLDMPVGMSGAVELSGREFATRMANFSIGRAVVFTCLSAAVFFVLSKTLDGVRMSYSVHVVLGVLGSAYISSALQFWASRARFKMVPLALSLIVFDQALFAAIAYVTGGVASGATSLFGIACLVGGLLLGVAGAIVAALAGAIFFSLLVLATQGGARLLPPDQPPGLYALGEGQAAYYYVFNLLMLLLVGLLASYLAERLQRTGGELKAAKQRAEQAERMAVLGRLAAGLAHEIRNPLGAISGSVQMIRSGAEREEDRDLCEIVLREAERLNELVSDMVDLSRKRQPDLQEIDVGQIVRDVIELASTSGRAMTDVELARSGPDHLMIVADAGQLRQLVWNLVRNALQATGSGGQVRVRLEEEPSPRLIVEDDGAGIDSESMERLFDAFYTTRSQGTGLGLAVVKRIADEHEFDITVTSNSGEGTRFEVNFGPQFGRQPVA